VSQIHIQTLGTGKTIVLVHGWAMHSGIWGQFAQQLALQFRVICVDLPGHGYSQSLEPFELAQVSKMLAEAVDEPVVCWLGWSLGASIVLDIATRFPERVKSLILLAGNPRFLRTSDWPGMSEPVLDGFAENLRQNTSATLLRFLSLQINTDLPEQKAVLKDLKHAVQQRSTPDWPTLQGGLQILKTADFRESLADLNKPVSVILGDRDTLVPVAIGQKLLALSPNIQLTVLHKAGHVPFLSHTQEVLSAINVFMEQECD
jgi:pimeloyl-[acyl-carrier protein] methyl ester esterase